VGGGIGTYRARVIAAANTNHLPTTYPYRYYAADGGLASYGPDTVDQYRRAASYIDRILKGEKPANLPVQRPTKYELTINLKTAKTLGLTVPQSILVRADGDVKEDDSNNEVAPSRGGEQIDDVLDGFVGAVVGGFKSAVWAILRVRTAVEAAVGKWSAQPFVEEQK